jgi:hypothetical protein
MVHQSMQVPLATPQHLRSQHGWAMVAPKPLQLVVLVTLARLLAMNVPVALAKQAPFRSPLGLPAAQTVSLPA